MHKDALIHADSDEPKLRGNFGSVQHEELPVRLRFLIRLLDRYGRPLALNELVRSLAPIELNVWDLQRFVHLANHTHLDQSIYVCDRFAIRCLCWPSGQRSSIHDHRGSRCCVRIIQGVLTNTDFVRGADGRLLVVRKSRLPAGNLLAREEREIHQVANEQPHGHDAVTLHVYSPPLTAGRTFGETP